MITDIKDRSCVFSPCRRYRYTLWREWPTLLSVPSAIGSRHEFVQFVGLNPSTATDEINDNTVRLCIGYAQRWGFGALCMTNAFAWRDTDPAKMKAASNPVGHFEVDEELGGRWQQNDVWLNTIAQSAGLIVAAWGTHGTFLDRDRSLCEFLPKLHCLGVNDDGTPKHPLYLKKDLMPVPYEGRAR